MNKMNGEEELHERFACLGQTLNNVIDNVESNRYQFVGGKRVFDDWKLRVERAQNYGERSALLIEADSLMREIRAPIITKEQPKPQKWKFWKR